MQRGGLMSDRNAVFNYVLSEHFSSDVDRMAEMTGFSQGDLISWRDGVKVPQRRTVEYLLNAVYTPEFTVIEEFYSFDSTEAVLPQLRTMYKGHEERSGIYAFYDSMLNLIYIGKAKNLLDETYSAIRREFEVLFPAGIKNRIVHRYEVVKYISAYDVKIFDGFDYPKHVESLILRISKPAMNKQIGILARAYPSLEGAD
jgi:hypothetical protein